MRRHGVRCLLMGGQACVFYGAAEFSRDTDLAILTSPPNLDRRCIQCARELSTERGALVPTCSGSVDAIADALACEARQERAADRAYWEPLRRELEHLRHNR